MSHQVDDFFLRWKSVDVSSSLFTFSYLFLDETFALCSTASLRDTTAARMSSFRTIFEVASTLKNRNGVYSAPNESKIGTKVPHFNYLHEKNYKNFRSVLYCLNIGMNNFSVIQVAPI
jgi:hypothetical protein